MINQGCWRRPEPGGPEVGDDHASSPYPPAVPWSAPSTSVPTTHGSARWTSRAGGPGPHPAGPHRGRPGGGARRAAGRGDGVGRRSRRPDCLRRWSVGGRRPAGIGIGIPGPVQHATGRIVSPSRMPGWNGFDVAAFCAGRVDVPVIVDNDANLMALGAHRTAHPEMDHAVYIKAGTGIGSGVIASGRLHRGAQGSAGDISHCRVVADPAPPCTCGNAGCLEAVASGAALVTALRARAYRSPT
ncbi:ROK family protein [Micromonospora sp. M12]